MIVKTESVTEIADSREAYASKKVNATSTEARLVPDSFTVQYKHLTDLRYK